MARLFFLLLIFSLVLIEPTNADFVYKKTIKDNQFSATTLDFSQLKTTNDSPVEKLFNINGILPGGYQVDTLRIKNQGETQFNYSLSFEKISGDDNFCKNLEIEFSKDSQSFYQGSLVDLNLNNSLTQDYLFLDWLIFLRLKDNYLSSQPNYCEFNLVITGFNNLKPGSGFKYKRIIHNYISSN